MVDVCWVRKHEIKFVMKSAFKVLVEVRGLGVIIFGIARSTVFPPA